MKIQIKKINENRKKIVYGFIVMALAVFAISITSVSAYECRPGDTECEEAKAKMQENQSAASNYTKKANSVSEIIEQLDGEIAELNGMIAANEKKIGELNTEIARTEKRLAEEQSALAEILVNMHFESDAEPIRVLAGATSISDLAEKAAREEVVKQEIVASSEKIKVIKADLNEQKEEVERALAANENDRAIVASKKEDQKELLAAYEKNADDAAATARYWEKQLQSLAWTPPSNTTGFGSRWYGTSNTYPYRDNCPQDNVQYSAFGGAVCQCTSYASYKAEQKWGIVNTWHGHAASYASATGYYVPNSGAYTYVNSSPAANTIAIWPATSESIYGHVAWVESVNADGSINISEYNVNWPSIGCYLGDYCSRNGVGSAGVSFMHFE